MPTDKGTGPVVPYGEFARVTGYLGDYLGSITLKCKDTPELDPSISANAYFDEDKAKEVGLIQ